MRAFSRFLPLTAAPERGRESAWLAQEPQGPKWQSSYLRAQYEAGERLRADYWFAPMNPRVTSNLVCVRAAGPREARGAVELGRASRRGDCRRWGRRSQESWSIFAASREVSRRPRRQMAGRRAP